MLRLFIEPLKEYWLTVVTFGMSSAPYLAIRAIRQCALDHQPIWQDGARAVLEYFYVDDCITGAGSSIAAECLRSQMQSLLNVGGFQLDK